MRIRAGVVVVLLVAGCDTPPPLCADCGRPPPLECAAGMEPDESGLHCQWIVPRGECVRGTTARVGEPECQPIGARACAAPLFTQETPWACQAVAAAAAGCAPGTAPFLGESGCVPVGWTGCPAGMEADGFGCRPVQAELRCDAAERPALADPACAPVGDCAAPLPAADLYVDPAGPTDATHFTTLRAAITAAAEGATIAVAAGTYQGAAEITRAVTIHGVCAAQVRITDGLAITGARGVVMRGVSLGGRQTGVLVRGGGELTLEDVVVREATGEGVRVLGAGSALSMARSVIRDVRSLASGARGRGLTVEEGGVARVTDSALLGCREAAAIAVGEGARIELAGVVITDSAASTSGQGGHAIAAVTGGQISGERVAITRGGDIAVLSYRAPSRVVLDQLYVAESGGSAVRVEEGGGAVLSRFALVDATATGILVDDATSTASVSDGWIARVADDPGTGFSGGLTAIQTRHVRAERVAIEAVSVGVSALVDAEVEVRRSVLVGRPASIGAFAEASTLRLSGTTLRDHPAGGGVARAGARLVVAESLVLGSESDPAQASSGLATEGSTLTVTRSAILGGLGFGVLATGTTAAARIVGSVVRGQRSSLQVVGQGVLGDAARLDLEDVWIGYVEGLGLLATGQGALTRVTIAGVTSSRPQNGAALALGGVMRLRDVAVVDSQLAGAVFGAGQIDVDGLLVAGTTPNARGEFGHGLLGEGTTLRARHVELRGSAAAGVAMDASTAVLTRSLIVKNTVGAHAQGGSVLVEGVEEEEAAPLQIVFSPDVLLLENATRLGVGTIPLPKPFEAR